MDSLILDYTRICNSRCVTCDIWRDPEPVTLDLATIEKVIAYLPLKHIFVTGGEPYLHQRVIDIAMLVQRYHPDCEWEAATNCISPVTELRIEEIHDLGLKVTTALSLEGNRDEHDFTRGVKGNYDRVMQVREFLDRKGLPYYFATVSEHGLREGTHLGVETAYKERRYGQRFGGIEGDNPSRGIIGCRASHWCVLDPHGILWACEEYRDDLRIGDAHEDLDTLRWREVAAKVTAGCAPCSMSCWY